MASHRDFLPAVRHVGIFRFVLNVWNEVADDDVFTLAAALAYSWLFAIFPFIIFLLTLAPYLPRSQKTYVRDQIDYSIGRMFAPEGAETLRNSLHQVLDNQRAGLLSLGLVITLWAASGGVAMTMTGLDNAFDAPKIRPFYQHRPLAVLLTMILTVMILLVMFLLPIGAAVTRWLDRWQYVPHHVIRAFDITRYGLALLLMFCVLSLLYKFGTVVKQKFAFFSPGAIFTVLVWIVLGEGFRLYVMKFGQFQRTYGAVGGVTIILFVFYLDALVLLIGAEINAEVDLILKQKELATSPGVTEAPAESTIQ